MDRRAVVMLVTSLLGLVAFLPVFALSTLVVFGDAPRFVGNAILLADLAAPVIGIVASVLAFRGHAASLPVGLVAGGLGLAAAAAILLVTWPWDTVIAVRNLLLLHLWAAFLTAASVWPGAGSLPGTAASS